MNTLGVVCFLLALVLLIWAGLQLRRPQGRAKFRRRIVSALLAFLPAIPTVLLHTPSVALLIGAIVLVAPTTRGWKIVRVEPPEEEEEEPES